MRQVSEWSNTIVDGVFFRPFVRNLRQKIRQSSTCRKKKVLEQPLIVICFHCYSTNVISHSFSPFFFVFFSFFSTIQSWEKTVMIIPRWRKNLLHSLLSLDCHDYSPLLVPSLSSLLPHSSSKHEVVSLYLVYLTLVLSLENEVVPLCIVYFSLIPSRS